MLVPSKTYSELLESLYAATLEEAHWSVFLSGLCEATQSIIALLIRNDDGIGRRFLASGGMDIPEGEAGYSSADPVREAFMRNPRTGVLEVEDFLPHEELVRSPYYPVMAKLGVTFGTCIVPRITMRRYDLISMWRGGSRRRLEPELMQLIDFLFPHIQTALKIHQAIGISQERARNAEAILDASAAASILLDAAGSLVYMNLAAQKLVASEDGVLARGARVMPVNVTERGLFAELVAGAASGRNFSGGAVLLPRQNGKAPLQVLVSSFRSSLPIRALVLISDPEREAQLHKSMLQQLYGFTPAETEVANGLVTGFSPEAIASIRSVSVGTVRSQIKSLLSKTETNRQVDLIRLLHAAPSAPPGWFE